MGFLGRYFWEYILGKNSSLKRSKRPFETIKNGQKKRKKTERTKMTPERMNVLLRIRINGILVW